MDWVRKRDVAGLLDDETFIEPLIKAFLGDPDLQAQLAEEVADGLEELLDDDARFRQRIADEFLSDPANKRAVIHQLADNLS